MDDGDRKHGDPPEKPQLLMCRKRSRWFVRLTAVWALIIIARMSQIMLFSREKYLADISRESWHRGMIPPQRGRILDGAGTPLAWSVRIIQLQWEVPGNPTDAWREWESLTAIPEIPLRLSPEKIPSLVGTTVTVLSDISPDNARAVRQLCAREPAFKLAAAFIRHHRGSADMRRLLGHTVQRNGIEIGVDGLERTHDLALRGRPGVYRVMVDPKGKWIMETWEIVQDMQAGYDVFLPRQMTQ